MNELHQVFYHLFGSGERPHELFSPYRVCPLGAHVDHQHGLVTGMAIDKGIHFLFTPTACGVVDVVSLDFTGRVTFRVDDQMGERRNHWGDYLRGVVDVLQREHHLYRGVRAVIKGDLPVGGLSSSAALLCGFVVCLSLANDLSLDAMQVIRYASMAERGYIGLNNGVLDQSCVMLCRKDQLLLMDTSSMAHHTLPFGKDHRMPVKGKRYPFRIGIFFSGVTRRLVGTDYNRRVDECHAAVWMIQTLEGLPLSAPEETFLRDIPEELFLRWYPRLPLHLARRAAHFFGELRRVEEGRKAWEQGDIIRFGELMNRSCDSSIRLYECGSAELIALSQICSCCKGIYGGRFAGAGFKGAYIALVHPHDEQTITTTVTEQYLRQFPEHADTFRIVFCDMADGIILQPSHPIIHYGINHISSGLRHEDVSPDSTFPQTVIANRA